MRQFTAEVVRLLGERGVPASLPDLPGANESLAPLEAQSLESWRAAASEAAWQLGCTHVLAIRAGANAAPELPGWAYAALPGKNALRGLLRARVLASKERGVPEDRDGLLESGKTDGLELAGYRLGPDMIAQLENAELPDRPELRPVAAAELGGPGLWLRAEPDHDAAQAEALVELICTDLDA
ncbi:hypothetical protein [Paraurantiacibacter namhicola]|uniref:Uncharacterized protein n=1 Tax=Paraurantiacibacter namhicola TaxID=645517 RepID=A0A1C7D9P2_9SPHN|nr:hypothetical protein [Paraurantiacibacter namhicola]ANU08145.1 hypothetical protein A6F65_01850 [Paraurantiacibacter namhicola]